MEKHILSKSTFIRGAQCLKSLYLNKKRPFLRDRLSDVQRAKFKRGTDVGVLAQQLFPGGIDLKPKSPSQFRKKVEETAQIIRTQSFDILYEAAFQYDQLLVLLDILVRDQDGWHAYEVKSSLGVSETYLRDAAFQYYVISQSGVELVDFHLITMNPDYKLNGSLNIQELFTKQNVLEEVEIRQKWIKQLVQQEKETLLLPHSPEIKIGHQCNKPYPCDFQGHCWKSVPDNSMLYLDSISEEDRFEAYYDGMDAPQLHDQSLFTPKQQIQLNSAIQKKLYIDTAFINDLLQNNVSGTLFFNSYFIHPAVPAVQNTTPYHSIPIAAVRGVEATSSNYEFFLPTSKAFELFIAYLRKTLSSASILICYDALPLFHFLEELNEKELLNDIRGRIIDLKTVFNQTAVYHYLLKGNYEPDQVSKILLKHDVKELNPAILSMNWQKTLFNNADDVEELANQTEVYLGYLYRFTHNFLDFLKQTHQSLA